MNTVTCPNCGAANQIPDEARAFRCPTCAADVRYTDQAPSRPPPPGWQPGWQAGGNVLGQTATKESKPLWRRPWVWVIGIILILIIASMAGGGGDAGDETDTTTGTADTSGENDDDDETASSGIGAPVADGQFTFTVTDFSCGETKIGRGFLAVEAQGQFCVADIEVENTGDEAATLDASSQYSYIDDRQYEASSEVIGATDEADAFFLQNINPGNSVQGIVVWDVPKGQKPDRLELHDSPFSGGVEVSL